MNLYEFLNTKDGFMKMNSNELNIVTLIKAFNSIESTDEQVIEIILHPSKLALLQNKAKIDVFEGKNIYKKIIQEKTLFGAQIIIDENISPEIIQLNGKHRLPEKSIKLFIEN